MKPKRVYLDFLRDLLEHAEKATEFIAAMTADDFLRDEKTVFAVIRALEVVGEAAKKIPDDVRERYPAVPWREMSGLRDKLIHDYFGVNPGVIWKTVTDDVPKLIPLIFKVIEDESI